MSDPSLSEIDFGNKMARVWTTLNFKFYFQELALELKLKYLAYMGFLDEDLNTDLLQKHGGNVYAVIEELVLTNNNQSNQ